MLLQQQAGTESFSHRYVRPIEHVPTTLEFVIVPHFAGHVPAADFRLRTDIPDHPLLSFGSDESRWHKHGLLVHRVTDWPSIRAYRALSHSTHAHFVIRDMVASRKVAARQVLTGQLHEVDSASDHDVKTSGQSVVMTWHGCITVTLVLV
jgi:hypothetical protein